MFRCTKCNHIDQFELMFSPDYKGKGVISRETNPKGEIIITVDGYTFTPDLMFMNGHAVCSFCGEINKWEYCFEK
jgi:hypothetical protein